MNFSELDLHPAVADALAARGYDTATPVQTAVLNPEHAARDLLVSSQTGSGKTVAFGVSLANTLLGPAAPPREQRTAPIALVVVPTRELAVQVRQELGWLLEKTGLRLASFTGGTAVSGDLRVLQRGVDVIIGTPGRLVDLLRRQRMELTHIRVVVLDEADEMLDLGFREDLQTLLQAAAPTRRTLLLSATLPPEIQALAKRFQRDALRIDPRKDGDPAARQSHGDITFVAHLISGTDRLAVVVNVLRAAGDGRAIVFCTTREGVSRLHAALVARGFAATAISGDRAQAERDRALEQVRRGDAQILVATNVAARGLHLPDVDLIIHADLPLNAESLTHRSGRTGRAGRKGTAVVIAGLSERRKAERLLSMAHVKVAWTAPPSADAITAAARERLIEELLAAAPGDEAPKQTPAGAPPGDPTALGLVERLEQTLPASELARRLLMRELARLPVGERVHAVAVPGPGSARRDHLDDARGDGGGSRDGSRSRERSRDDFSREGVLFRVNIGAKENAEARWLLPLICRRGGVTGREVGSIRIGPTETLFEIAGDAAADYARAASEPDPRAPHVRIERARPAGPGGPRGSAEPRRYQAPPARSHQVDHGKPAKPRVDHPKPAPHVAPPASPTDASSPAPQTARPAPHAARPTSHAARPAPHARAPAPAAHAARPAPPARASSPAPQPARPAPPVRASSPAPAPAPRAERPTPPAAANGPAHVERQVESSRASGQHPANRSVRSKTAAPVIEMKRAPHRMGAAGERSRSHPTDPPPREMKRAHAAGGAADGNRPHRNDGPRGGTPTERPRTDGTSPAKRSSGFSPSDAPARPASTPFWKGGARQRPSTPPRRHDGHVKKNNPPVR